MISIHSYAHFPIFTNPLAHPPFWRKIVAAVLHPTPARPSGSVQKPCSTKISRTPTQIFVIFGAFADFSKKTRVFRASGRAPRYRIDIVRRRISCVVKAFHRIADPRHQRPLPRDPNQKRRQHDDRH